MPGPRESEAPRAAAERLRLLQEALQKRDRELRILSFFPTRVQESTFQDPILPLGSNVLASNFNQPQLREITPDELPPELRHLAGG